MTRNIQKPPNYPWTYIYVYFSLRKKEIGWPPVPSLAAKNLLRDPLPPSFSYLLASRGEGALEYGSATERKEPEPPSDSTGQRLAPLPLDTHPLSTPHTPRTELRGKTMAVLC